VKYTRCRIDTINSPDDGHMAAPKHVENRNKHTLKRKEVCVKLVIYKDYTEMLHGHQNMKHDFIPLGEEPDENFGSTQTSKFCVKQKRLELACHFTQNAAKSPESTRLWNSLF